MGAIILAGGFGTRLRGVVSDVPKPLAPVGGRAFLAHQLDWLFYSGISEVVVTAHYMADQIIEFVHSYRENSSLKVTVVYEDKPLGTGGAVVHAFAQLGMRGDIIIMNGDTHYNFDLSNMIKFHAGNNADVTMSVAYVEDCARFGTVQVADGKILSFEQATGLHEPGLVNSGLYMMSPLAFEKAPQGAFSIEKDFFDRLAKDGQILAHQLIGPEAFFDIGTPESYAEFCCRFPDEN